MGIITSSRKQKVVYWPPGKSDDFGRTQYGDPVEVNARWDDMSVHFLDAFGETVTSEAVVMVDRPMKIGGWLWLGRLQDVEFSDPSKNEGAKKIRSFQANQKLKPSSEIFRQAFL